MKIVKPEDVTVESGKTDQEIADLMGDDLKEVVFVYIQETNRTTFIATVVGRLTDDYAERGEVFTLIFEEGFSEAFAEEVKKEIGALWKGVIQKKHIDRPEDFEDPDNVVRKRWLRAQTGAKDNTLEALQDFIIH